MAENKTEKKEKKLNWEALSPDDQMKYEIAEELGNRFLQKRRGGLAA